MKPSLRLRATRRAFTLIELLTVIAIIGILAAILIPTVGAVRAVAKKANCASNLREIGRLCLLYANENKGFMPAERSTPNGPFIGYYYSGNAVPKSYDKNQFAYPIWPYYAKSKTVTGGTTATSTPSFVPLLVCPSYDSGSSYPSNTLPASAAQSYTLNLATTTADPVGYNIFPYGSGNRSPGKMITLNNISQLGLSPSRVWLMQDYFSTTASDFGIPIKPLHGNSRNRLYMDGSVRNQPANIASSDLAF